MIKFDKRSVWAGILFVLIVGISAALAQALRIPSDNSGTRMAIEASANGTTGSSAATLGGVQGRTTYICGFAFSATNATAALTAASIQITGLPTTLVFGWNSLAAGATVPPLPPLVVNFSPCQPASAQNTSIVVTGPAPGAGATFNSVSAWGYSDVSF